MNINIVYIRKISATALAVFYLLKMVKRKRITLEQRSDICALREEGYKFLVKVSTLDLVARHQETVKNEDRKTSGRPKSTTNQADNC